MAKADITVEKLKERLFYDAETGLFTRRLRYGGFPSGSLVGTQRRDGYLHMVVLGKQYLAHRLAWLYSYGKWPAMYVDHINGIKSDNRLANLRDVSHSENLQNLRQANFDNRAGLLGVVTTRRGICAQIVVNGKSMFLGYFATPELAHEAYIEAKRLHHMSCTI